MHCTVRVDYVDLHLLVWLDVVGVFGFVVSLGDPPNCGVAGLVEQIAAFVLADDPQTVLYLDLLHCYTASTNVMASHPKAGTNLLSLTSADACMLLPAVE